jgi:hypothetical protein
MKISDFFLVLWLFLSAAGFVWTFVSWRLDVKFYRNLSWDFSKNSGRKLFYGAGILKLGEMPNKERVLSGYFRAMFIFFAFFLMILTVILGDINVGMK